MTSMASITRPKRDVPGLRDANLHRLEHLAAELRRRDLAADVMVATGRIPRLEAARIACAAGPGEAAARIEQVLNRQSWG
jgi:hypothetical protein